VEFNKYTIYIARGGNWIDIKNLFTTIKNKNVNVGRGGSQKSHALSPIDFRLSTYLMAMFNFDYNLISSLNLFNMMSKDRYLSYMNKPTKSVSINLNNNLYKEFEAIRINKMPLYSQKSINKYNIECIKCNIVKSYSFIDMRFRTS
jgi:hypothetical protein